MSKPKGREVVAIPTLPDREHVSISVRPIANGHIVSHTTDGPDGYKNTETFHKAKPKVNIKVSGTRGPPAPKAPQPKLGKSTAKTAVANHPARTKVADRSKTSAKSGHHLDQSMGKYR